MACGRGDLEVATAQLASGDQIDAREPNVSRLPIRTLNRTGVSLPHHCGLWAYTIQSQGTALYFSSLNGHLEVVQMLLEKNADANVANRSGQTPLHVAQTPEIANALLDAGCDEHATNKVRGTAFRHHLFAFKAVFCFGCSGGKPPSSMQQC